MKECFNVEKLAKTRVKNTVLASNNGLQYTLKSVKVEKIKNNQRTCL